MFLGWDCANKTLAWSRINIDLDILNKLAPLLPRLREATVDQLYDVATEINTILNGFIKYESAGVVNLVGNKKTKDVSEIDRARALSNFLRSSAISAELVPTDTQVIIEHQNVISGVAGHSHNMPSSIVGSQLAFYYANHNVMFIDPKLKNTLVLGPGLDVNEYIARELAKDRKSDTNSRYIARKNHSKDTLLYVLAAFNQTYILNGIKKAEYDDLADSTTQIFAEIRRRGLIRAAN